MKSSLTKTIYCITGASAVGKTTLVDELMKRHKNKPWSFIHFDSIEVPSPTEMAKEFGSPSAWQKIKTFEWIDRLMHEYNDERIFFEGQMNLQFIHEGFAKHEFKNYHIVLLDCNEDEMRSSLTLNRAQPELFTEDMKTWLQYLRMQALESATPILHTSNLSPQELVKQFEKTIGL
jgi:hypothetical protein